MLSRLKYAVRNLVKALLVVWVGLSLTLQNANAQAPFDIEIHGFLMGNYSLRTSGQRPPGDQGRDFLLAEERLRMEVSAWTDSIEASGRLKADFIHDAVAEEFDLDLREAYLDYTAASWDFRLGRQVATWGVGDLVFINDIFPKDWVSFFSGRPLEYLKIGVDGLRTRFSSTALNADFFIIPFFEPDKLPGTDRFILYDPFAGVSARSQQQPATTWGDTELALRLYQKIGGFDVSAYAYRGFWRTPSIKPDSLTAPSQVTEFFPRLAVFGLSAQGGALKGVLSLEAGYYYSWEDENGNDPSIPNSQFRFLAGYQRQLWKDFQVGLQYYAQIMESYSAYQRSLPPEFPAQSEYSDTVTLRLEQLLRHHTLGLSLFIFYRPADEDYLLRPRIFYKFQENLSLTLGANLFGGEKDTTFMGQFDQDDNIYLSARWDF